MTTERDTDLEPTVEIQRPVVQHLVGNRRRGPEFDKDFDPERTLVREDWESTAIRRVAPHVAAVQDEVPQPTKSASAGRARPCAGCPARSRTGAIRRSGHFHFLPDAQLRAEACRIRTILTEPTPFNSRSNRNFASVRSGSSPSRVPIAWSVVVTMQRVQPLARRNRTAPP